MRGRDGLERSLTPTRLQSCPKAKPDAGKQLRKWQDLCEVYERYREGKLDAKTGGQELEKRKLASHGGDRRSEQARKDQGCNRNLERRGTVEHWKARLRRDDPALAARVERGELSANAAAVAKGWRKKKREPVPYDELRKWWAAASPGQSADFEDFIADWRRKEAA